MPELKRCPFCGSQVDEFRGHAIHRTVAMACPLAMNNLWWTAKEWERRPIEDALQQQVTMLTAERATFNKTVEGLQRNIVDIRTKLGFIGFKAKMFMKDLSEFSAEYSNWKKIRSLIRETLEIGK